jgi:hypothetical protein
MKRRFDNYIGFFAKNPGYKDITKNLTNSLKTQAYEFYSRTIAGYKLSDMISAPNELLIHEVVINAIADIARIRDFHPIEHPTRYKYAAYVGYWWLRTKPFCPSIRNENETGLVVNEAIQTTAYTIMTSINEIFICDFMIAMIGKEALCKPCENYSELNDNFQDLQGSLIYFMQYRQFSAQQLEMFLKAINVCPMAHSITETPKNQSTVGSAPTVPLPSR